MLAEIISSKSPLKIKSFLPLNFAITKIRVEIRLAEDGTRIYIYIYIYIYIKHKLRIKLDKSFSRKIISKNLVKKLPRKTSSFTREYITEKVLASASI